MNTDPSGLPIKCSEILIVGSALDAEHQGPFGRFKDDLEIHATDVPINSIQVCNADEFEDLLLKCREKARDGYCPLIHIDMHASKDDGVIIGKDELVPWKKLCQLFSGINEFTQNQMMVILFSCHGLNAIKSPDIQKPAPFVLLAAPSSEIATKELSDTVLPFYIELLNNGIDVAWPILRPVFQIFIPELIFRDEIIPKTAKLYKGKAGQKMMENLITQSLELCPTNIGPSLKERRLAFKRYKSNIATKELAQMKVYMCGREPCFDIQLAIDNA